MTMRLGLSVTDSQATIAVVDGGRVKQTRTIKTSGSVQPEIARIFQEFSPVLTKLGRKLKSVHVVTDAVATGLKSNPNKVALLRLSAPEGRDSPPLISATSLRTILTDFSVVSGGHGEDARLIGSPDENEIRSFYDKAKRAAGFVVSSPFSILENDHEKLGASMLRKFGAEDIWLSSETSYAPCILDRESTSILSASGAKTIRDLEGDVLANLKGYGCKPVVYFARNDGSSIGGALARRFPLDTAWSVEAHSALGAARILKKPSCIAVGSNGSKSWLAGTKRSTLLTRTITYFENMILHVTSPVIIDFEDSFTDEIKRKRFDLISELSGTKGAVLCGIANDKEFPFQVKHHELRDSFATINATFADVSWEWGTNVRKGLDVKKAERNLRSHVTEQMKKADCKPGSLKLGQLRSKPGTNLPEGTTTLTLHASGKPH